MKSVSHPEITQTDADGAWDDDSSEVPPVRDYSEQEIASALQGRTLTADQVWYMHIHGINWQIQVR